MSSDFGKLGQGLPASKDELVDREVLSPNHDERAMPIDMLVIHYTEMEDKGFAIERLCDPEAKVSAHYLIGEWGEKRAWHAGQSYWRGHKDVNSASIGIELDHPGHKYGYREFNDAQFEALVPLVARIVKQYDIPRTNVVGHSDVAPARKIDPGELFPWERLAEYGLCLPRPKKLERGDPFDNDASFYLALERFGYASVVGAPRKSTGKSTAKCARSCSSFCSIATGGTPGNPATAPPDQVGGSNPFASQSSRHSCILSTATRAFTPIRKRMFCSSSSSGDAGSSPPESSAMCQRANMRSLTPTRSTRRN